MSSRASPSITDSKFLIVRPIRWSVTRS
jgi:hypothetical protein